MWLIWWCGSICYQVCNEKHRVTYCNNRISQIDKLLKPRQLFSISLYLSNALKCWNFWLVWSIIWVLKIICCYMRSLDIVLLSPENLLLCRFLDIIIACRNDPFTKPRVVHVRMTCFEKALFFVSSALFITWRENVCWFLIKTLDRLIVIFNWLRFSRVCSS